MNIGQSLSPSFIGIQTQVDNNSISDPNALYVIWGGANDYLGGVTTDPNIPVGNLTNEIATLISNNAKNILVVNLPNLGELPSTRNTANPSGLNTLTQFHNAGLAASINNLSTTNSSVNLKLLDVNSLFNQAIVNPSSLGLNNVTDGCLLVGCTAPDNYLFWDDIHPTTATHQLIGNLAFQTVSPTAVPEPTTVIGSLMAGGSIVMLKRKLKSSKLKANQLVKAT